MDSARHGVRKLQPQKYVVKTWAIQPDELLTVLGAAQNKPRLQSHLRTVVSHCLNAENVAGGAVT